MTKAIIERSPTNVNRWLVTRRGVVVGEYQFRKTALLAAEAANGSYEEATAILVSTPDGEFRRMPVRLLQVGEVPKLLSIAGDFYAYRGYSPSVVRNDFTYEKVTPFTVRSGDNSTFREAD